MVSRKEMAWIPAVAANRNRNCCRSNKKGVVAGLVFLFIFGVLFFFLFGIRGSYYISAIPWILISSIGVFMIVIVIIGTVAASMASPKNQVKLDQEKYEQSQLHQLNPYRIQRSSQNQVSKSFINENQKKDPVFEEIRYCNYCGVKLESNTRFCHQCGSKLSP